MLPDTPWPLFSTWLDEAVPTEPRVPESMQIATVAPDGMPSLRTVLLKDHGPEGLVFYTNLGSQKAKELALNGSIAFLLHFKGLERQIRGEGVARLLTDAEADAYHATRPRGSQIGAWASSQSSPIESREALLAEVQEVAGRFAGQEVPRPPHWGGYRIIPHRVEFWQGHPDRLHDRFDYRLSNGVWSQVRLSP